MTWGYPILETPMLICGRHLPFSGKHGFRPSLIWMCFGYGFLDSCFEPMLRHKPWNPRHRPSIPASSLQVYHLEIPQYIRHFFAEDSVPSFRLLMDCNASCVSASFRDSVDPLDNCENMKQAQSWSSLRKIDWDRLGKVHCHMLSAARPNQWQQIMIWTQGERQMTFWYGKWAEWCRWRLQLISPTFSSPKNHAFSLTGWLAAACQTGKGSWEVAILGHKMEWNIETSV